MIGIYKITNLINGKIYIGQSVDIDKRIKDHFWKARCKKDVSYNSALHSAIRKYGEQNFKYEVLEECTVDVIDERERYYIQKFKSLSPSGYNILVGGQAFRKDMAKENHCTNCGSVIFRNAISGLCRKCYYKSLIENRPTKEFIVELLRKNNGNFSETGRNLGVSYATVKKWCKDYNMSHYSADYKTK